MIEETENARLFPPISSKADNQEEPTWAPSSDHVIYVGVCGWGGG